MQHRSENAGAAVRHSLGGNRWPDRPCRGELATTFTTTFLCLVLQGITGENAATFSLQACCSHAAGTVQLRVWPCTCNPFAALCRDLIYTPVAAGEHCMALLRSDSSVVACGCNEEGNCDLPAQGRDLIHPACGKPAAVPVQQRCTQESRTDLVFVRAARKKEEEEEEEEEKAPWGRLGASWGPHGRLQRAYWEPTPAPCVFFRRPSGRLSRWRPPLAMAFGPHRALQEGTWTVPPPYLPRTSRVPPPYLPRTSPGQPRAGPPNPQEEEGEEQEQEEEGGG